MVKLSDRIRPDCEAAPWVITAIKELEQQLERQKDQLADYSETNIVHRQQLAAAQAQIAELRDRVIDECADVVERLSLASWVNLPQATMVLLILALKEKAE